MDSLIRWKKGDYIKLGQAVSRFNKIVSELEVDERDYLPDLKDYDVLKKHITSRKELNRVLKALKGATEENLIEKKAYEIFKDNSVGNVIRVKGFVKDGDEWCELNATAQGVNINRFKQGQNVVIVIGEKLNVERINEYFPADYSTMQVNENAMNTAKKLKE